MREGPEFVLWFVKLGTAVVLVVLAISVALFWWLKRWSARQAAEHEKRAGAKRRP